MGLHSSLRQPGSAVPGTVASVAVDVAVFTVDEEELRTLLVQVKRGPFAGQWAFPGGLVPSGEALDDAATRELRAVTGVRDAYLEQLYTFGDPDRDPHAHVVSVSYIALLARPIEPLRNEQRYAALEWRSVDDLPRLAYGHQAVVAVALGRLRAKLAYSNIAFGLLPEEFSLGELQRVYEIILGRRLDRRNFRRKILLLGLLRPLHKQRRGAHRPAALYAFAQRAPTFVDVL
jgi:8-oxo-dGTP diphosphatase